MSRYAVTCYADGRELEGSPSPELVRESERAPCGTGAVAAYRDDKGVWQYVPPSRVSDYDRDPTTRTTTVYVEDGS